MKYIQVLHHKLSQNTILLILLFLLIFATSVFFRFYQLEDRAQFTWDQVNNAWAAKDIIVDHRFPLLGMTAKLNSGIAIGPAYYYFITPFYWFTKLDPIASPIIAGVTSIITFFTIFFVIKNIFSPRVAFVAIFLYTFSYTFILADRIQWPVNFIVPISLGIFYCLFNAIKKDPKYLIWLGFLVGLSFHVHFTSIFYLFIIPLSLPLLPRRKETLLYGFIGILLFIICLTPILYAEVFGKSSHTQEAMNYAQTNTHGFHLRRLFQITRDAFVEYEALVSTEGLIRFKNTVVLEYLIIPLFILGLLKWKKNDAVVLSYLTLLWFIIPWVIFSLYTGELTNYYFSITRPIAILEIAYLLSLLLSNKHILIRLFCILLLGLYAYVNTYNYFHYSLEGLAKSKIKVKNVIKKGEVLNFVEGYPEPYLYYLYTRKK